MLEKKIAKNLKAALKEGDKVKVSVLRMLVSAINNKKIEARVQEMDDDNVLGTIQKTVKQHKESIEKFSEGGREDLVDKEKAEMAVLEEYLPEPISVEVAGEDGSRVHSGHGSGFSRGYGQGHE
ncbi:MAG: GatB/YqeY domain-containing protein [Candidatus Tantalella remota]|nr:GatB/YqeY domain-containing protein [Candidatus Tantalella remota]